MSNFRKVRPRVHDFLNITPFFLQHNHPQPRLRKAGSLCLLLAPIILFTGCARGPSGGPSPVNAPNRMTVTLTLQQPVNDLFYYSFAFDDDNNTATGPAAIIGPTNLQNGVVGGAFTVLVQYHAGQFLVWRRTDLGNSQERLDLAPNAFVTAPPRPSGNTITFTLDLDAMTESNVRLFTANTQRLDTNFVTTSEVRRDTNDLRRKPFDAFGPGLANFYNTFNIQGTQTYTKADLNIGEPNNDVPNDSSLPDDQLARLDITDFTLQIQRF